MKICVQKIEITNHSTKYSATNKLTIQLKEQSLKNSLNIMDHTLKMIKMKIKNNNEKQTYRYLSAMPSAVY